MRPCLDLIHELAVADHREARGLINAGALFEGIGTGFNIALCKLAQ
jgi:hypothetical protein